MKAKVCMALMVAMLSVGNVAYGQSALLKQLGRAVAREIVTNVKKNNAAEAQREAILPKEQAPRPKSTTKAIYPLTENTYRNPMVVEEHEDKVDFEIDGIGYSANKLTHVCKVLGPEYAYIRKLKKAVIVESILYNDVVYQVLEIAPGAFKDETITSVQFPQTLEKIGSGAFSYSYLTGTVEIPSSVKYIGSASFAGSDIQKVVMKDGVETEICNQAFLNCKKLEEVVLPTSIKSLGDFCFENSIALKKVHMPLNIKVIAVGVFGGCTALESIVLPSSIVTIKQDAFRGSGLRDIYIPEGVSTIGYAAFADSKISTLYISKSVEKIDNNAFSGCKNLKHVTLPIKFKDAMTIVHIFDNDNPNLIHTSGNPDDWHAFHWIE